MKLCFECQNIFHSDVYDCPLADCAGMELIDIDDQLVDIVMAFHSLFVINEMGLFTKKSCAGHLWRDQIQGYLTFAINLDHSEIEELENFKGLLDGLNVRRVVDIDDIEISDDGEASIRINTLECGTDRKERLKIQWQFLNFLYEAIDAIDLS